MNESLSWPKGVLSAAEPCVGSRVSLRTWTPKLTAYWNYAHTISPLFPKQDSFAQVARSNWVSSRSYTLSLECAVSHKPWGPGVEPVTEPDSLFVLGGILMFFLPGNLPQGCLSHTESSNEVESQKGRKWDLDSFPFWGCLALYKFNLAHVLSFKSLQIFLSCNT